MIGALTKFSKNCRFLCSVNSVNVLQYNTVGSRFAKKKEPLRQVRLITKNQEKLIFRRINPKFFRWKIRQEKPNQYYYKFGKRTELSCSSVMRLNYMVCARWMFVARCAFMYKRWSEILLEIMEYSFDLLGNFKKWMGCICTPERSPLHFPRLLRQIYVDIILKQGFSFFFLKVIVINKGQDSINMWSSWRISGWFASSFSYIYSGVINGRFRRWAVFVGAGARAGKYLSQRRVNPSSGSSVSCGQLRKWWAIVAEHVCHSGHIVVLQKRNRSFPGGLQYI